MSADPWDDLIATNQAVQDAQDALDDAVDARYRAFLAAVGTYTLTGIAAGLGMSRQMATRILTRARERYDTGDTQ